MTIYNSKYDFTKCVSTVALKEFRAQLFGELFYKQHITSRVTARFLAKHFILHVISIKFL